MLRAYRVTGRVQGVGFRWFVRKAAAELGLPGSVRNAMDGSVEVVAEGPEEALAHLERQLRKGPPAASVDQVETLPAPERPVPDPFQVLR